MVMDPAKLERIINHNTRLRNEANGNKQIQALVPTQPGNLIVRTMRGLGDTINQRAFIKELNREVWLDTPWPELYEDLPKVHFIPCQTTLRTQDKNIQKVKERFIEAPKVDSLELNIGYNTSNLREMSIMQRLSEQFGCIPKVVDLPKFEFPKWFVRPEKLAVVRPCTERKEWWNSSRNCDPKYVNEAVEVLIEKGYIVVSVADLEDGKEWLCGEESNAQIKFHSGELSSTELLGLIQECDVMAGVMGWFLHAAVAAKKPMLVVTGGFLGENAPEKICDPKFFDWSQLCWVLPDNPCKCHIMKHDCDKTISNFRGKAERWIASFQK